MPQLEQKFGRSGVAAGADAVDAFDDDDDDERRNAGSDDARDGAAAAPASLSLSVGLFLSLLLLLLKKLLPLPLLSLLVVAFGAFVDVVFFGCLVAAVFGAAIALSDTDFGLGLLARDKKQQKRGICQLETPPSSRIESYEVDVRRARPAFGALDCVACCICM